MKNNNIMRKNKFMTFFKGMQKNAKVENFQKKMQKLRIFLIEKILGNY